MEMSASCTKNNTSGEETILTVKTGAVDSYLDRLTVKL